MSFSSEVKDELSRQIVEARHCQIAEVAAIISLCGRILISAKDTYGIKIHTENIAVARKYFQLIKKIFQVHVEVSVRKNVYLKKAKTYTISISDHEDALRILQAAKLIQADGEILENLSITDNLSYSSSYFVGSN